MASVFGRLVVWPRDLLLRQRGVQIRDRRRTPPSGSRTRPASPLCRRGPARRRPTLRGPVIVRGLPDDEAVEESLVENIDRDAMDPIDEVPPVARVAAAHGVQEVSARIVCGDHGAGTACLPWLDGASSVP
jgi:hypothetical protein